MERETPIITQWLLRMLATVGVALPGCIGDAKIELAAADAIEAVAVELERSVGEYHRDLGLADDARSHDVIHAFVDRIQGSAATGVDASVHAAQFRAALARIASDRSTESKRYAASLENITVLRETARGLRRIGINALSLEDETKRYFRD